MRRQGEQWSGGTGFILATIGSAVGLGSIWKFPYEVGSNGGGGFVFFYLLGLGAVVFPLMLAEFAIGRRGQSDAVRSIRAVALAAGASPHWKAFATLGVSTAFLILSFYSVIGGWAIAYVVHAVADGIIAIDAAAAHARFAALLASPWQVAGYHAVFMVLCALIVVRGIARGIEEACKILMPLLIVLVVLAAYSIAEGGLMRTLHFMFAVDLTILTPRAALEALGLGFFSIGVGLALMITYAAYAGREINLCQAAIVTLASDTAISFLSGFAIFPMVFAHGLDPASGPGLMFVTMPLAFAVVPFGAWAAGAFFVLVVVAALASAISMLEMPVALLMSRLGWRRAAATAASADACWIVGLASVVSFNLWAGWFPLAALPGAATATVFDLLDQLTSNVMLPVGGFGLAVFAGWMLPGALVSEERGLRPAAVAVLRALLRFVVPLGIAATALAPLLL